MRDGSGADGTPVADPSLTSSVLDPDQEHYAFPASLAQERMWFLSQLDPGSTAYLMASALSMRGAFDLDAFGEAVGEIVRRHEILRTGFRQEHGTLHQVVLPEVPHVVEFLEPSAADSADMAELLRFQAARPFELTRASLLRITVLRLAADHHLVVFAMHHIIADAWSLGVLVREVAQTYLHAAAGAPFSLPELEVQYADYTVWQRDWLESGQRDRQLEFWRRTLRDAPRECLPPTDRPRTARPDRSGAQYRFRLPAELAESLHRAAEQYGAPVFTLCYAAFAALLSRYGQSDVVVGTPIANRRHTELEDVVGLLANTLVLRLRVAAEASLRELVRAAADTCFDAYEHQDLPFDLLVEDLRPSRVAGRHPLFQAMIVLQNAPLRWPELPGLRVEAVTLPNTEAKFDLLLELQPDDEGLAAEFEYVTGLFDHGTVRVLAEHYLALLRALVTEPERALVSVSLPTAEPVAAPGASVPGLLARAGRPPHGQQPPKTAAYLDDIAVLHLGPEDLAGLLGYYERTGGAPPESVEAVLCPAPEATGGLPRELVDTFYRHFACELYSYYLPPWASGPLLAWQCRPGHPWPLLPLGHPVRPATVAVLDRQGSPVLAGAPGRLCPLGTDPSQPAGPLVRVRGDGAVEPVQPTTPEELENPVAERAGGRAPGRTERRVLALWSELLGRTEVGLDDSFFALGGHSVLATQLTARMRAVFGVELEVRAVFENPTPAALARLLESAAEQAPDPDEPGLHRGDVPGPIPLSVSQQRLWFLDRLAPGGSAYTVLAGLRLTGWLDTGALRAALCAVVDRHEGLRTVFAATGGVAEQVVLDRLTPAITVLERPGADAEVLAALVRELAEEPFDLANGPLLRALLVRTGRLRHLLVLSVHHIVCDGWSLGVLLSDVAETYAGSVRPAPELRYVDFARWQRVRMDGPGYRAGWQHWAAELAGMSALDLPVDHPRPPVQTFAGATVMRTLPRELSDGIAALAARTGTTEFMVTLAAFQALLGRWAGSRDVAVGSPVANRDRPELDRVIGFVANTVVLRGRWTPGATFAELLDEVRRVTLAAQAHQDFPFEHLLERLAPERDTSRSPLFTVAFALDNTPPPRAVLPDLVLQPVEFATASSRFDLTLFLGDRGGPMTLAFEYNTDLFDATTIERFARWYQAVLAIATGAESTPIADLPGMSEVDERLLAGYNDTAAAVPTASVHELIARHAQRHPSAIAVEYGDQRLSHAELERRVAALTGAIRAALPASDGGDPIVAVHALRSFDLVVALLAVLRAGAAYLPLDPDHPVERTAFVLADAVPALVLSQQRIVAELPAHSMPVLLLDRPPAVDHSADGAVRPVHPDRLAYVLYTSGSTGLPKGAMNTHAALANRLHWMQRRYRLDENDAVLQKTPFSFDVSVWEFLWPLLTGARLVLAEPGAHRDTDRLAELIATHRVTTVHFVPSVLTSFLATADSLRCPSLHRVVCSGEALGASLRDRFHQRFPAGLHNLYGPTEAAIDVTHWTCDPGNRGTTVPIGHPIDNLRVLLLDARLRPVPVGFTGEICLAGAGLARGYLNRPSLTAERFVADPTGHGRIYRTGDLGRIGPEGALEYLGRTDDQIKLRGVRIEPGEVETALAGHPAVHTAAVALAGDRLVALAVPDRHQVPGIHALALARAAGVPVHRLPDGRTICHHRRSETEFLYREIVTERGYLRHGVHVPRGATVFDVGANIGMFGLLAHGEADAVRVWSFEPIPASADLLRRNKEIHRIDGVVAPYGLGAHDGPVTFTYYPHVSIVSGQFADRRRDTAAVRAHLRESNDDAHLHEAELDAVLAEAMQAEQVPAEIRTLSSVVREHGVDRIDLLKIDVESAELDVLTGIAPADWPRIRQVVVEVHDIRGRLATITDLLTGQGFEVATEPHQRVDGVGLHLLYAVRPDARTDPADPADPAPPSLTEPVLTERLLEYLRARLPGTMVPSTVRFAAELPVTGNGKLDRTALASWQEPSRPVLAEPSGELETALLAAWRDTLGRDDIGVTDDFFSLGGHSLLLPRLLASIVEHTGRAPALSTLFRDTTVRRLAGSLDAGDRREPLTSLATGPPDAPRIVLVHPLGGHLLGYRDLATALAGRRTVSGLIAPGADGVGEPASSVRELAAHHRAVLRDQLPRGPYHLAGWSFGGVVAFELARQLHAENAEIGSVTLLDAHLPAGAAPAPAAVLADFATELGLPAPDVVAAEDPLAALLTAARAAGVLPEDIDGTWFAALWRVYRAHLAALREYRPEPWPGPVTLLRPSEAVDKGAGPWASLLPEGALTMRTVPGDHQSMVRGAGAQACARLLLVATEQNAAVASGPGENATSGEWSR